VQRLAGYGEMAGLRDRFVKHFAEFFSSPAPDTQEVANAILRLVHVPPATRPIRTVCGVDFGTDELNRVFAPFQAAVLRALGLEIMTPCGSYLSTSAKRARRSLAVPHPAS
jgi:hypothetical protein